MKLPPDIEMIDNGCEVFSMDSAESILEPYFQQIKAGNQPTFENLIQRYMSLIDGNPNCIETACLTALLIELYPALFEEAIDAKMEELGFPNALRELKDWIASQEGT
jgi:hypothetical protein